MKNLKKIIVLLLTFSLVTGVLCSTGWAEDTLGKDDPIDHEWNVLDLMVARPLGVAAAIGGTGVFIVSLPFTLTVDIFSKIKGDPASAVHDAAKMFMLKPLKFSFTREFPDEDI